MSTPTPVMQNIVRLPRLPRNFPILSSTSLFLVVELKLRQHHTLPARRL